MQALQFYVKEINKNLIFFFLKNILMWDNTFSEQEKVKLKLHQKANWVGVIEKY